MAINVDGQDAPRGRATLVEVALRAGVSLKTASRAINGEPRVRPETRERVLRAADELGFKLNRMASMLRRGTLPAELGFVTGDLENPFYSSLAKGIELTARQHGLHLTIASSDEDPDTERSLVAGFVERQARGIILVSTLSTHGEYAGIVADGVPLVFTDRAPHGLDADAVVIDNRGGAETAVRHLLSYGHRRIGLVGDYARIETHRERLEGFEGAMAGAGVAVAQSFVAQGAHGVEGARELTERLLRLADPPTALFTANNRATIGALHAVRAMGTRTAIIGFDDFELADYAGITVIGYDTIEMGRNAAKRAWERADRGAEASIAPTLTTVIPTTLIVRGSAEFAP